MRSRLVAIALAVVSAALVSPSVAGVCPPAGTGASFLAPGPYGVGVRTLSLVDTSRPTPAHGSLPQLPQRTLTTEVWYPTVSGAGSLAPVRNAVLKPNKRFPLVVHSHGYSDSRLFAQFFASLLASRGYVVAAIDFPLTGLGSPAPRLPADVINQPGDVSFVIDQLLAGAAPADWLARGIDKRRIGLSGLSYGGLTTLLATYHPVLRDKRVRAALALAPLACAFGERFYRAARPPILIAQGDQDLLLPIADNGARAFARARSPRELVTLFDASHTGFTGVPLGPATTSYDATLGCAVVVAEFTPAVFAELAATPGFVDPTNGVDVTACGLPCQGPVPSNAPMQSARQQEITKTIMSAFFDSTLRHTGPARCFLKKGLPAENADLHVDVHKAGS
jgi:predicted dienelactone hydrolase